MNPSRPRGPHDRESNHRTPAADAPSERLPSLAGNLSRVSLPHARDAAFSFDDHPGLVPINGCAAILNFLAARQPGSMARVEIIGDCTLYLGDCLEILPTLGKVDAVVTDPPYGLAGSSGTINIARAKAVYEGAPDTLDDVRNIYVPAVAAALSLAKRGAVTPGTPHSFEYPKPDDIGALLQPAVAGMSKWGRPTWQPVLFYGKDPRSGLTIQPLTANLTVTHERNGHPCPKPIEVMLWMVERASLPGEVILDPFMGSGTTGVACINLGRKFIGIEIEPKYFDIACRRIEEAYKQPRLFAEPASKATQEVLL